MSEKTKKALIKKIFLKTKKNKFRKGFTVVEVVVTSGILLLLMSMAWSASSLRGSDFTVMVNQEKLRVLAMRAKSLTANSVFEEANPACGYGIRIEQNQAFIFLDKGACGTSDRRYNPGEEIGGSMNAVFASPGISFIPSISQIAEMVFIPPYFNTVINGDQAIPSVSIEVRLSGTNIARRLLINNQGLIDVIN